MAITIQVTPNIDFQSVHSDLIYTVAEVAHTADPVTYPNYKFIGDVYVFGDLVARIKKVPDPVTKIGIFNIGQIVRNYLATVFNPSAFFVAQIMGAGESFIQVMVKFGEEYAYTEYTNLVSDTDRYFFNNYNPRLFGQYSSLQGYVNKFISTRPDYTKVYCGSRQFIPLLQYATDGIRIRVKKYIGNVQQGTDLLSSTLTPTDGFPVIDVSPNGINTLSPGYITCDIDYYSVTINTVDGDGDTKIFKPVCENIYEVFTLHFLNKFGGFESKDFTKVSRKTIQIEKKDFGRLPYTVDSSGIVSYKNSNNVYNESRSVYSSQYKEKMVLNTDILTDAEYSWLEELVLSPMVYLQENGYYYPVVITETNYERKKIVNDELTNLTLSIEFGETKNAQFR